MIAIAYYLLKVIVCSGILFLYYHVALRNKIFHQWNRFYLLAAVALSLTLPLMQIAFYHYNEAPNQAIKLLRVVASADDYMETIYITQRPSMTTTQWLGLGYLAISVLILSTLIVSVVKIYFIVKTHRVQFVNSIKFISTEEQGTPFSFFSYIFWNDKIDIHSSTGQQIFQHELVHVKEAHTFDKLFLQIILIFFWCNPFFWLIRKELQMIHEFIADKKAVQQHDTASLAAMILQASYPHQFSHITNPFFQSSIKRRILMLTKIQNPRISYLSRILVLPLIAFVVFAFSFKTKNAAVTPLEKPITVVIDAGHGKQANGITTGASEGNTYEDDIVLSLAKQIKELNVNDKINIVLTRNSDEIVDLHKRVDFAQEKKADLFISLHVAAAQPGIDGSGMEVYVSNKNTPYQQQSELLGSVMKEELSSIYSTKPDLIRRQVGIWVLDKNVCPAILVECGYITNQKDRNFITDKANQKLVAKKILDAIERYAASAQENRVSLIDTIPQGVHPDDIIINGYNKISKSDKQLIIINGEKFNAERLKGKVIRSNNIGVYQANDPQAIKLYGKEAINGVMIFKDATIDGVKDMKTFPERTIKEVKAETVQSSSLSENASLLKQDGEGQPLYFVDGKEFTGDLNKIEPNTIESINVLKDRSAIAKYGEKGKDGVIEIITKPNSKINAIDTVPKKDPVFSKTEIEASVDKKEWRTFLEKNLQSVIEYAASMGMPTGQYTVNLRFLVKKDGSITDFKTLNDPGYGLAQKILEIMQNSPKWSPGLQNGKKVTSYHTQPITFVISDGNDSKEKQVNPANTSAVTDPAKSKSK